MAEKTEKAVVDKNPAAPKTAFNIGDPVTIVQREATPGDIKSGLYYAHFGGLQGRVLKVYGEEASIQVDRNSLPEDMEERHGDVERGMRQKWLDGLSEEAKNKLGEKHRAFTLGYAVLVSLADLQKHDLNTEPVKEKRKPAPATATATGAANSATQALNVMTGESDISRARESAG